MIWPGRQRETICTSDSVAVGVVCHSLLACTDFKQKDAPPIFKQPAKTIALSASAFGTLFTHSERREHTWNNEPDHHRMSNFAILSIYI